MADAAATTADARATTFDLGQAAIGVGAAAGIGALGAADGGYFAPSWGWTALVGLWLVVAWLLLGRAALHGGRLAGIFAAAVVALAGWTWLSLVWSENGVQTALEGFRLLAYAAVAAALVLVVRPRAAPALLRGLLAAIALVSIYGLGTRLFPDRLGTYDPISTYRLAEPVGYWNGLGIFAAMGALIALGILARDRSIVVRALAGGTFALLLPTMYFTFSRGAWVALALGVLAAVALDARRLQLLLALMIVSVPAAIAVWIGSQSGALTHQDSALSAAADQGQEVAALTLVLALLAAAAAAGLALAERRVVPPRSLRLAFAAVIVAVAVAATAGILVRAGGPVELVERGYDAFAAPPPPRTPANLNERLFRFTGYNRVEQWEEAWNQFVDHPFVGGGAGTYEQYWNEHRPIPHKVRDSHSLYLETLGELGVVGFALLLVALGAPLVAAVRARRHPLAAAALGAYAAYLFHAAIDWDWELPAVTLAAFACGAALLVLGREGRFAPTFGSAARIGGSAVGVALSVVAFVGLVGASALSASDQAAQASPPDWAQSADEAEKAKTWAPWSSEPWQRLGEAQLAQGRPGEARASFRKALEKEPDDWLLWYRLAEASSGAARRVALREVERLNPLGREAEALRADGQGDG